MEKRASTFRIWDVSRRESVLRNALLDGAAWEPSSAACLEQFVAAVGKKKFRAKRIGARACKQHELLENPGANLSEAQRTQFRALAARANYLALDRPDIAFAAKELCRQFAQPTDRSVEQLKRMVRYLVHNPRLTYHFDYVPETNAVDVYVDTDFAGCLKTRRSTSGGLIMMGPHLLRHWSVTQPTIALSSGEAELVGIVRGASQSLGFRSMALDLGFDVSLRIKTDASAAIGICRRRGLGRIRHLAVSDLWVQERLRNEEFELEKIPGADNPADVLTKHLERPLLSKLLPRMHVFNEDGRAQTAPTLGQ